jgi:hypothetical protein
VNNIFELEFFAVTDWVLLADRSIISPFIPTKDDLDPEPFNVHINSDPFLGDDSLFYGF